MRRLNILILLAIPLLAHAQSSALNGRSSSVETMLHKAATKQTTDRNLLPPPQWVDTLYTPDIPFTSRVVSMHGYAKRLGDARESFILRNETHNYRISRVVLKLVYSLENGREIYRRNEIVECDIRPGETQSIAIKSFDKDNKYYYFPTPPQRAEGVPYRVQYDVLRYDVVVEK